MASEPSLRILVDGDSTRVYRHGDKVIGRAILTVEKEEELRSLTLSFAGSCTTRTTRPFYVSGNDADATQSRREYEEHICLFNFERKLLSQCEIIPKKYTWSFEFQFPDTTGPKFARWQHGPKYLKDPHALPPCFQTCSTTPGGQATISYYIQARLERLKGRTAVKTRQLLPYHPTPRDMPLQARITSRVLYAQAFKPLTDSRTAIDKVISKLSRQNAKDKSVLRLVPTLHYPERISPGQRIPLLLSLINTRETPSEYDNEIYCTLDSVTVTISTHTTTMCGHPASMPEDTTVKTVTCLSKTNMNTPIPLGTPVKLTNNFRLVDDAECVPSFKTYTITRRYDLTVVVGIKYGDRKFTIRCKTLLEILPRLPPELMPNEETDENAEIDPLPLYVPWDPEKELAPDYDSLYSMSRTPSSLGSLALTKSGSVSMISVNSTPSSELEHLAFEV